MIQVRHEISPDRRTLTLTVGAADQSRLVAMRAANEEGYWATASAEGEVLDHLIGNSELGWIEARDTGDLTGAPILGIIGAEELRHGDPLPDDCYGKVWVGGDEKGARYVPVWDRWGYEPYRVMSFMDDLANNGKAVFQSCWQK